MGDNRQNLWGLAQNICNAVLQFQPEVVVVLMNSAWLPFLGGLHLWQSRQSWQHGAFPAVVQLNLGREKQRRYNQSGRRFASGNFGGLGASDLEIADYLCFLAEQRDWLEEMRQHFWIAYQGATFPQSILVMDDWLDAGGTFLLASGLLHSLYPHSKLHFVCGERDWKSAFWNEWLSWYHPRLSFLQETDPLPDDQPRPPAYLAEKRAIYRLTAGYEGISSDSLESRPISAESELLQPLLPYLPAEEWLKLPRYAEARILGLGDRQGYQPGSPRLYPRAAIPPLACILQLILQQGEVSVEQARRRCRLEAGEARQLLEGQVGRLLEQRGEGRRVRYTLSENAGGFR